MPEDLRVTGQRQLGRRVVENQDVPHRCSGGAGSDLRPLHQGDTHASSRKGQGTCGADNPTANNDCVKCHGVPMPQQNASRGSRMSVDSAVMKAAPVMLGNSFASRMAMRPSKTLPITLSWRQTWPGAIRPSAYRQASLALVPVPQGERSYSLPGQSTKFRPSTPGVSEGPWSSMWSISAPSAP